MIFIPHQILFRWSNRCG